MKLEKHWNILICKFPRQVSVGLLILLFLGWPWWLSGQEELLPDEQYRREAIERRDLDRATWREVTRDLNYFDDHDPQADDEASDRQGPMGNEEEQASRREREVNPRLQQLGSLLIKVLIIAGAGFFLFFLLRGLLGIELAPRNRKIRKDENPEINFDRIEENLPEADLGSFIRQAEEAGLYAQALRLHYLHLLQQLADAGLIRWKKGKTNHDYERELAAAAPAVTFRELTAIFERIWYGEAHLNARRYQELAPRFREAVTALANTTAHEER